ncbi:MAG: hypothetical protein WCF17_13350 [Terracidiphilus sp.]
MEMLLMGLCVSVFGLAMVAIAFRAATRSESSQPALRLGLPAVEAARSAPFVPNRVAIPLHVAHPQVPVDLLLLQIENHVRLEHAAAESFIGFPSEALLHSKTGSTFVN